MKKIYIAGGGGMLGEAFYRQFKEQFELKVTDIDLNESWISYLDFRDFTEYKKQVKDFSPDYLFHLGAHTDLEYCEKNIDDAYETNSKAVEYAVAIANELNIPLLYIGTAGIFDGRKQVYDDWDEPNPLGHYARSKYLAERYVQGNAKEYLICRAGWMMGGGPGKDKKFVGKVLAQLKAGKKQLHIVNDKLGTPTYTDDFARNVRLLLEKDCRGLYNMACSGETGRIDIAKAMVRYLGKGEEISIEEVSSEYYDKEYFAPRPPSEQLVNKRLQLEGNDIMRDWKVCLQEYLRSYPNWSSETDQSGNIDISVVICSYNRASFIGKAIDSVLDQAYPSFELIVIDDGSTDGTSEVVKRYQGHRQFKYFYQPNKGRSEARNEGVRQSRGKWIMYLDSDDYLQRDALKVLFELTQKSKESGIVFANFVFVNSDSESLPVVGRLPGKSLDQDLLLDMLQGKYWLTKTGTYLVKREIAAAIGGFSTTFEPSEDLDYALKALIKTKGSYSNEKVLCVVRHEQNTNETLLQQAILKICKHHLANTTSINRNGSKKQLHRFQYALKWRIANGSYQLDQHGQAFRYYIDLVRLRPASLLKPFIIKQLFASLIPSKLKRSIRNNHKTS